MMKMTGYGWGILERLSCYQARMGRGLTTLTTVKDRHFSVHKCSIPTSSAVTYLPGNTALKTNMTEWTGIY